MAADKLSKSIGGVPSQFSNEPDLQDTSLLQLLLEKYTCRFHNVSITSVVGQKTNNGLNSSLVFLWRCHLHFIAAQKNNI
jgi:hypothetical protein